VSIWFRTTARRMLEERLLHENARLHAYLDRNAIAGLLSLHASGAEDCGIQLWRLWALEEWLSWLPAIRVSRDEAPLRAASY
jgi:hypothetical protein